MVKDLVKELEDAGFKVDDYSGEIDGEPIYILDLYGHKRQKSQIRIIDHNWFTFRQTANEVMRKIKSTSKMVSL